MKKAPLKLEELTADLQHTRADFENYRKNVEKDKETLVHNGDKTKKANQAFGETNINELLPSESVRNNIEENGIHSILEKDRLGSVHKAVFRILCISKEA